MNDRQATHLRQRLPLRALLSLIGLIAAMAMLGPALATEFPVQGAQGDRGEQLRCPDGYVLVGFVGRVGAWIDQISPMCSELLMPAYATGGVIVPPARGGNGGNPASQYCERDAAVRSISFRWLNSYHFNVIADAREMRPEYLLTIDFNCSRPKDGQVTGGRTFGGTHTWTDYNVDDLQPSDPPITQACPANEYASGVSVRYGKHVNALGLICSAFEYHAPAPPSAPPHKPWKPSPGRVIDGPMSPTPPSPPAPPASLTTGTFDTTFGLLELRETEGSYSQKNGHVTIIKTKDNRVKGIWEQSTAAKQCADGRFWGKFVFTFDASGFTGTYGYCNGPANAGAWNGTRR